jgi:hypothetical protein
MINIKIFFFHKMKKIILFLGRFLIKRENIYKYNCNIVFAKRFKQRFTKKFKYFLLIKMHE